MAEGTDPGTANAEAAKEAFSLVGNEVRADILGILASPEGDGPWKELSFSELHSRVDPGMDSGQFNYHLQQLVGRYVEQTESGYKMRPEGVNLYRSIVAGTFTREETLDPIDAGFDCHFCGTRVSGSYEDGQFSVRCPGCEHTYARNMLPPSVVEDEAELLRRVDQSTRHDMLTAAEGVCPTCLNGLDLTFIDAEDAPFNDGDQLDVMAKFECSYCGARRYMSIGTAMIDEASLVAFAHDRGLDVHETPVWELEFAATDRHLEVRSRDPWEFVLDVTLEGETLELVIDDELEVVDRQIVASGE